MTSWFEVNKAGLAKVLAERGPAFVVYELIANALDTKAHEINVILQPVPGVPKAVLIVDDDDPDGFCDLAHAWTMFNESPKGADADKRGRFDLGEKLVLALCEEATITSTKGTVSFGPEGRRQSRQRTQRGTVFTGTLRMTAAERAEVAAAAERILPPAGVVLTFNWKTIPSRPALATFSCKLPTVVADAEGYLRSSERVTEVTLHEVGPGEEAMIYELGIPVVATGDRYHVNVQQRVPLTTDRSNVTPAYLRRIRVAVLNAMAAELPAEDASAPWVREAASDKACSPEAITKVVDLRFGRHRVIADPTDPEGTKIAVSQGYTVIHGGALSAGEWANVKAAGAALPAGQVTPSPKPFAEQGKAATVIPESEWTRAMRERVDFAQRLARELLDVELGVRILNDRGVPASATYARVRPDQGNLTLNFAFLGPRWFGLDHDAAPVLALLIHEFAHHRASDHLSSEYHEACCALGAEAVRLALRNPSFFNT